METACLYPDKLVQVKNTLNLSVLSNPEKYISPAKLRDIYRKFCQWKLLLHETQDWTQVNFSSAAIFTSAVTHYLLERCYWIRYGDNDVVMDLLRTLLEMDGHLGKIFDYQQISLIHRNKEIGKRNRAFKSTWSNATIFQEVVKPVDYFLEHSNKKRALFNGERFVDLCYVRGIRNWLLARNLGLDVIVMSNHPPCSITFQFPEILVTLLQYGLFATPEPNYKDMGKLLTGIIGVILCSYTPFASNSKYTLRMIEAGKVLLRAVPNVNIDILLKKQKLRHRQVILNNLVKQISIPQLLPYLKERCSGPQQLQHMCRREIRSILYKNWNLPRGIELLPVPKPLKMYINLQLD